MIARFLDRADWGPSFWGFAAHYYTMPWYALRTARTLPGGTSRISRRLAIWMVVSSYLRLFFAIGMWTFFVLGLDELWVVPLTLGVAAIMLSAIVLLRLEAFYISAKEARESPGA